MLRIVSLSALLSAASALAPAAMPVQRVQPSCARTSSVCMAERSELSRRGALAGLAAAAASIASPSWALDESVYMLKKDYREDAQRMLDNMRVASELTRGTPDMEEIVGCAAALLPA